MGFRLLFGQKTVRSSPTSSRIEIYIVTAARRREWSIAMADLICSMICKHSSKRPLRKWRNKDGSPCFGCSLKYVKISRVFDMDGDICAVAGEGNMAHCAFYEPLDEPEGEEDT